MTLYSIRLAGHGEVKRHGFGQVGRLLGMLVSRGCLVLVPWIPTNCVTQPRLAYSSSLKGAFPRPWPSLEGYVYRLACEAPLFRWMSTEPEAFWGMPGVSGLRSGAWTSLKNASCHTRLLGGVFNKYHSRRKLVGVLTAKKMGQL